MKFKLKLWWCALRNHPRSTKLCQEDIVWLPTNGKKIWFDEAIIFEFCETCGHIPVIKGWFRAGDTGFPILIEQDSIKLSFDGINDTVEL